MIRVPRRLRHQAHRRFLCMYACVCTFVRDRASVSCRGECAPRGVDNNNICLHTQRSSSFTSLLNGKLYIYVYVLSGWVDGWMPVQLHQTRKKYIGGLAYSTQRLLSLKNLPLSYVQNSTPVQSAPRSLCVLLVVYHKYTHIVYDIISVLN